MKKLGIFLLAAALLAAMGMLPFRAVDAAKLLPVKTVIVTKTGDEYVVDIGAGVRAVGRTLREALDRMREEVTGEVFLPTAEQVIITEPADGAVEAVAEETEFRPAAGVYRTPDPNPDTSALGAYLDAHPSNMTILDLRAALAQGRRPVVPVIRAADGGYRVDG